VRLRPERRREGRYPPECARGAGVEWKRVEVGLGLLEASLASDALALLVGYKRAYGELGERDGRDERFDGQRWASSKRPSSMTVEVSRPYGLCRPVCAVVMVGTPRMSVRGLGWRVALRPTP
jgi:hypothetical protein